MKQRKSKAFTLIELIAVLVIMAIIALIATPLVMNIIRKARISADRRSVDAYGRSIELAIAGYLLDNGKFPTEVSQLTIEYSGDEVVCETTQINPDSSVYLAGCTVNGRSVEGYAYGKEEAVSTHTAYEVGDQVTYNNINYYVIKDSAELEQSVTLLKAEPLSAQELSDYKPEEARTFSLSDQNDDIGMQYHASSNSYETSYVKTTVNAWAEEKVPAASEARLLDYDDLKNLGYELVNNGPSAAYWVKTESTPIWVYNYRYWTMEPADDTSKVWFVETSGSLAKHYYVYDYYNMVRPVIVLPKSAL